MSVYNSDDERGRSPGLEAIHYNYKPEADPKPQIPHSVPSRGRGQGDSILIRHIDPEQPEIAREDMDVGLKPPPPQPALPSPTHPEIRCSNGATAYSDHHHHPDPVRTAQSAMRFGALSAATNPVRAIAMKVEHQQSPTSRPIDDGPVRVRDRKRSSPPPKLSTGFEGRSKRPRDGTTDGHVRSTATRLGAAARRPSLESTTSIVTSPLADCMITESEGDKALKLPAMMAPSPGNGATLSPQESLPSVSVLQREISNGHYRERGMSGSSLGTVRSVHSRESSRNGLPGANLLSPFQPHPNRPTSSPRGYEDPSPTDPVVGRSPERMNGPGNLHVSRRVPPTGHLPPFLSSVRSSTISSVESNAPSVSSASANTTGSTSTDGLTPSSMATPSTMAATPSTSADTPQSSTSYTHYPGLPIGGYRCNFDGCDAAPFATQYLLNSHTNVHSSDRPHFCEVEGCARSERGKDGLGGKGFKRKNEMVRHGLVHDSPGYICPWCPDRAHKYPRPDNLQRHVRMHHDDKPKDDPGLKEILAQRFTPGQTRGRKKRGG